MNTAYLEVHEECDASDMGLSPVWRGRAYPGFYIHRPDLWIGPFGTKYDADKWDSDNPESLHDQWRRDNPASTMQFIKPEDY